MRRWQILYRKSLTIQEALRARHQGIREPPALRQAGLGQLRQQGMHDDTDAPDTAARPIEGHRRVDVRRLFLAHDRRGPRRHPSQRTARDPAQTGGRERNRLGTGPARHT